MCGTTASLCGLESALTPEEEERALACDIMLHAWMLTQSGVPVLYSGDEIAQLNDYSYHDDPDRREDSRYVHRGRFRWDLAERRNDPETRQGKLFSVLRRLETLRAERNAFRSDAIMEPLDTGDDRVLALRRHYGDSRVTALFNFSETRVDVRNPAPGGRDALTGTVYGERRVSLPPYGFLWLDV